MLHLRGSLLQVLRVVIRGADPVSPAVDKLRLNHILFQLNLCFGSNPGCREYSGAGQRRTLIRVYIKLKPAFAISISILPNYPTFRTAAKK
jgi:hypothetical protein